MARQILVVMSIICLVASVLANPGTLLGYTYPAPLGAFTQSHSHGTADRLTENIFKILKDGKSVYGDFKPNTTSVAIEMTSATDHTTLFDLYFHGETTNRTAQINRDSVFRIGSVSKVLTVYAFLLNNGYKYWDAPVTDFVGELRAAADDSANVPETNAVRWEDVTLGTLCSQLSGIGRDYTEADLSSLDFPWVQYGLPPLNASEIPTCGSDAAQPPCSKHEYLRGFVKRHPVFLPYSTPVYSNAAFRILSYAMENITGRSYEDLMAQDVFHPLDMTQTGLVAPKVGGVIPKGDSQWDFNLGQDAATGGLYSSVGDLSRFAEAILTNAQLQAQTTRRWLKPLSHTASLQLSIGAPWEIWRTRSNIATGRVIDLYTKSGSIGEYNSLLIIIPDFQVSLAILTAGPDGGALINAIAATAIEHWLPVLERTSKISECRALCGQYSSQSSLNSSLEITMDDDNSGLAVARWISNGSDMFATARAYAEATAGGDLQSIRIVPSDLGTKIATGSIMAYRVIFQTGSEYEQPPVFFSNDSAWASLDQLVYGKTSLDDLLFSLDSDGLARKLQPRGLKVALYRS